MGNLSMTCQPSVIVSSRISSSLAKKLREVSGRGPCATIFAVACGMPH